jgi:asparagine synthase (glutamine-hydrolysing)
LLAGEQTKGRGKHVSVFFGIWNFDHRPVDLAVAQEAQALLAPYGPDASNQYNGVGFTLAHHALHTTAESRGENQPYVSSSGAVIAWDGRLDNREELVRNLGGKLSNLSTDVEIVAACFDRWDTGCFPKILGDWAVSIWNERQQLLLLAKDFLGVRPLYYMKDNDRIHWSSVLEPLVTLSKRRFALNREYVAGWLAMYPATDTTPFVGIRAVPPCSFVIHGPNKQTAVKYWDFDPEKRISLRTDVEYEDCFRVAFREAVRRRLRSDRPICAELSGGMDSPSITCMADLIANSSAEVPEIHTLSFYDDTEPHLNERRYFLKVEEKRGRRGCHIDLANNDVFSFNDSLANFVALPGCMSASPMNVSDKQRRFFESNNIGVVLSGIGGDEMMGGVPTPIPELQNLLVQGQFRNLAHMLKLWALSKRKPWFHLLGEVLRDFLPPVFLPQPKHLRPLPWLEHTFVQQNRNVLSGFNHRTTFRRGLPSFQANLSALETVRRQLATNGLAAKPAVYKRYPFLDRTLLELIFAIPRDQLLRPGYRRSLMRRALRGIVPEEVLERRRKGYVSRGPRVAITREWNRLVVFCHDMASARMHVVNEEAFRNTLQAIKNSDAIPLAQLGRTIVLEAWLRQFGDHELLLETEIGGRERGEMTVSARSLSQAS